MTLLRGVFPEWVSSGSGSGDGDGSGSGSGSGDGDGSGSGSGYGDGSGSGSGYGSGDGSGYGYGSGSGYWRRLFEMVSAQWPEVSRSLLQAAMTEATTIAFWRSDKTGKPANGGMAPPVAVGDVHEITGPLRLCSAGALHATMRPEKWQGERLWVVALYGEVAFEDDKCGALKRQILGEIKDWKAA